MIRRRENKITTKRYSSIDKSVLQLWKVKKGLSLVWGAPKVYKKERRAHNGGLSYYFYLHEVLSRPIKRRGLITGVKLWIKVKVLPISSNALGVTKLLWSWLCSRGKKSEPSSPQSFSTSNFKMENCHIDVIMQGNI